MFLRKQIKMKQMLTNIGMGILLTACGNGGMDPVDTGGEDEYVPVRVETVTDNGIGTRAVTLSNAAIGIFRTAPYSATFPQQYNVEKEQSGYPQGNRQVLVSAYRDCCNCCCRGCCD